MYIVIGGIEQWVEIGGENPDNPVLLYLHGGPGGSSLPAAAALRPWERHFTVVHWDHAVLVGHSRATAKQVAAS